MCSLVRVCMHVGIVCNMPIKRRPGHSSALLVHQHTNTHEHNKKTTEKREELRKRREAKKVEDV